MLTFHQADMFGRVWWMFCDVDGDDLRQHWKFPFGTKQPPELSEE